MNANDDNDFLKQLMQAVEGLRLPRRFTITREPRRSPNREIADALRGYASEYYAEQCAIEAPVRAALEQYGGKITADYIQYAPGRWRMAGEFADIPKRFLKRPDHLNPNKTRVDGNLGEVAEAADMDTQDLKDFLSERRRWFTKTEAFDAARNYMKAS